MTVFANVNQGFAITGLTTADLLIEVTLAAYSGPGASSRYFYDGRYPAGDSSSYIYIAGGSTTINTSSVTNVELDGAPITILAPADITGGEVLSWVASAHNGDLVLFNRFSLNEPVNLECTQVTIKSSDGLTTLHTYDLSNPAQSTITDTAGNVDGELLNFTFAATPTISNVDGDNAVNQGQLVNIDVSDFTETITSGSIGGTAFPSIPDNDPSDDVIQVRIPVTLSAGTYDVTISGATESATISGVAYSVTHPYQAPYAPVDSNSDWKGQKVTEDTYWRVITPFAHGTYDFTAGAAETPPFGNDINDHFTPDAGYVGSDSEVREVLYADGTTAQYTVNIEIGEGGTVVVTDGLWRDLFRDPTSEIFTELFR